MNAADVDLGNLMLRCNAQAMEIVRLRQLLESSVVRDPWLIAVINLVHEHHALGTNTCVKVTISHFPNYDPYAAEDCRFVHHDHGWISGATGNITLEHMMASIPKLCAMGLHIFVRNPGRVYWPFTIHWGTLTPQMLDEAGRHCPHMMYYPPTGPCTMFDAAADDE